MACCLMAPSLYLNQCRLIICKAQWHSSECNFTRGTSAIGHWNKLENYVSKILFKSPRGQWVNIICVLFQDFSDLQSDAILSDPQEVAAEDAEDASSWQLSDQEMEDLCSAHQTLFISLTKSPWMVPVTQTDVSSDWTEPVLLMYGVASSLSQEYHNITGMLRLLWKMFKL